MRLATYASVAVALTLIAIKIVAWLLTDSVSLLSSLIDSLLDLLASLVNLLAVRHALTPADPEHRFGHGKAEPLAGLAQAAFIGGSAVLLLLEAGRRLLTPQPLAHAEIGIGVMVVSMVMTLALVAFQRHVVKRTGSVAISADELHYRSDILLNSSVILALVLWMTLGWRAIDPLFGAAIGCFILYSAYAIVQLAMAGLMDRELPDEDRQHIEAIVRAHPDVLDMHDLRTRASGPSAFIQLHLEMDGQITLDHAHRIADEVEGQIRAAFPQAEVIIHEDPVGIDEQRQVFTQHR